MQLPNTLRKIVSQRSHGQLYRSLGQELSVAAAFQRRGWIVSLPYQQAAPYDLIAEIDGKLYRVQVKKSHACRNRSAADGWAFKMKCLHCNKQRRYTRTEVDAFATVFEEQVYLYCLAPNEVPPRSLPIKSVDLPKYLV